MDPAVASTPASAPPAAFEDGLGERRHTVGAGNEPLEVLRLSTVLSAVSSFEFALRERAGRLATFRHPAYGRVRAVERLDKLASTLVVVSDHVPGVRLSELLAIAERRSLPIEIDAARCLIRQLVSAVAALQEMVPDICHGAIGPGRIVITPDARAIIVEYVLGSALEQLRYSQDRYWRELGVAVPAAAGPLRFDLLTDVTQMGTVALALLIGRRVRIDEYPAKIDELVSGAAMRSPTSGSEPMAADLREWLLRALQLDPHGSFASAVEAQANLDFALGHANPEIERSALQSFLLRCGPRAAPDAIPPQQGSATTTAAPVPDKVDPTPGLEALRSFLSRYPSRDAAERTAAKPVSAASSAAPSPLPPAPLPTPPATPPVTLPPTTFIPTPAVRVDRVEALMTRIWPRPSLIVSAAALILLTTGVTLAGIWYLRPSTAVDQTGTLVVGTSPGGIKVVVDGVSRGPTPLSLNLPTGDHVVELVAETGSRQIPVRITAGGQVSQFIEMPRAAVTLGSLQVRTEPSRAEVVVDGQRFGRSPLTVQDLTPGIHTVVLQNESGPLTQQITIAPGTTASLVVSMTNAHNANTAGWVSVTAPADVQVYEGARLLGSNRSDRIMMSVGRHELELVNEALGYRATRIIEIKAGQVSMVKPEWPQGALALNAMPWAEVWVDGERIGETPLGNVPVPIGTHEIVFRHPSLGERRASATVPVGAPTRVGVDLRTK